MGLFSSLFGNAKKNQKLSSIESRDDIFHFYTNQQLQRFSVNNSFRLGEESNTIKFISLLSINVPSSVDYAQEVFTVNYDTKTVRCDSSYVWYKNGTHRPTRPIVNGEAYAEPQTNLECIYFEAIRGFIATHGTDKLPSCHIFDEYGDDGVSWHYKALPCTCELGPDTPDGQNTLRITISKAYIGKDGSPLLSLERYKIIAQSYLVCQTQHVEFLGEELFPIDFDEEFERAEEGTLEYAVLLAAFRIYAGEYDFMQKHR